MISHQNQRRRKKSAACILLGWSVLLLLSGCQDDEPEMQRVPTYPASGRLLIDGEPAAGATIKLYSPERPGAMPTAIVQEDGRFRVGLYEENDGAPSGEYTLIVAWLLPPPEGGLPQDRLEGRFSDPKQPAALIRITTENNDLGTISLTR